MNFVFISICLFFYNLNLHEDLKGNTEVRSEECLRADFEKRRRMQPYSSHELFLLVVENVYFVLLQNLCYDCFMLFSLH